MAGEERRKYKRIDMNVRVELSQFDEYRGRNVPRSAQSRNISRGGLLVTTDSPIEISSFVRARFTMPGTPMEKEVVAKVVRVDEVQPLLEYDIGLEFMEALAAEGPVLR